ncbi:MAG: type II secretion system protein [Planctomycetes bacterium]|nr:type II secretion system protein [Planctomycetota bacterium]
MVVILIVAILAAVAIPIMRGRIDAAKWSEGKAIMGTIASALRAYIAEKGLDYPNFDAIDRTALGFLNEDLSGTYFNQDNFTWVGSYDRTENDLVFTITATAGESIKSPTKVTLAENGEWVETAL